MIANNIIFYRYEFLVVIFVYLYDGQNNNFYKVLTPKYIADGNLFLSSKNIFVNFPGSQL